MGREVDSRPFGGGGWEAERRNVSFMLIVVREQEAERGLCTVVRYDGDVRWHVVTGVCRPE